MNKNEFNEYCVGVMGYEILSKVPYDGGFYVNTDAVINELYSPYEDLNQMAEVVEKLVDAEREHKHAPLLYEAHDIFLRGGNIKKSFRDFIESTAQDNSNE